MKENTLHSKRKTYLFEVITLMFSASALFSLPLNAQMASGHAKFVGNIFTLDNQVPTDFDVYWNQITPGNGGKWGVVESRRDTMNWTNLDLAYNHARTMGYVFKEHTFVWGNQEPSWIDALSPAEQAAEVEQWIQAYGVRYPNTDLIDVVNEPLHVTPSYANAIGGSGTTGWDWVIWAFEKARQYNPTAKLLLNDYSILGNTKNTSDYLKIITLLQDRGLIDGIGVQAHGLEYARLSKVKSSLDNLAATGLPIYVSELDIDIADDNTQLSKYQDLFPLLYEHPGVAGITLWGYRAGYTWKANSYLLGKITTLGSWTVSTSFQDYTTTGSGNIRVVFTNDDVDNTNDLQTDYVILDGVTYQAEDMEVNTGVWQNSQCGGSYSEWMNCNGYTQYPAAAQDILVRARGVNGTEAMEVQSADMTIERPALQWLRYDYFGQPGGGGGGGGTSGIIAEAEEGTLTGTVIDNTRTGFSGTGYVTGFDTKGDKVQVSVDVPSAGDYPLNIRYAADQDVKVSVAVNGGVDRKNFSFPASSAFTTTGFTATFNSGANTISIFVDNGPSGGPIDVDYFEVAGAKSAVSENMNLTNGRDVNIFPNPSTRGNFIIDMPRNIFSGNITIHVADLQGRLLYNVTYKNNQSRIIVNTSLRSGIYIVTMSDEYGNRINRELTVE